ncbi:hypothetical protein A1O1_06612 [Capronia coronata CBS 617.96]|uniref:tRNA (guanine(10)-N(2))-methyltransferase n=1 Tax=Capronia coronata CBS 617.96 TaxID=1182541 RepID=W9Y0A1_9EURO|nr:uncharacterized protein A1O1_06612 [Capronia coronata CBS 617.96]EXJ86242.1 hypothetical protein A1O1_06612 [Capronia coronata CBS 617.96]
MDYLVRFAQAHERFRRPELEALADLARLPCEIVSYAENTPFCIVWFPTLQNPGNANDTDDMSGLDRRETVEQAVRDFESRAILSKCIYEIWGQGADYEELDRDVTQRSRHLWDLYKHHSFKFSIDCYGSSQDAEQQRRTIDRFKYLGLLGKIRMKDPQVEFAVLEEWLPMTAAGRAADMTAAHASKDGTVPVDRVAGTSLRRVFLARKIGDSQRWLREKHDLKKRPYISTTSMDAELALVTANMALASPGKMFLDPFVGTGGFMVAAAELGAVVMGSDIDGRSYRGKGAGLEKGVGANFKKYGLEHLFVDCMCSDLTNTPFRRSARGQKPSSQNVRWLDGIVCDPPYGVREGLKVLGTRTRRAVLLASNADGDDLAAAAADTPREILVDGIPAHKLPGYIAPKKPYSFSRMLDDILDFAAATLVDGGRLAFWMPSANENDLGEEEVTVIPTHPHLLLKHECVQRFNKWSRRLLVYERLPGHLDSKVEIDELDGGQAVGDRTAQTADELNPFRKRYFQPVVDNKNGS